MVKLLQLLVFIFGILLIIYSICMIFVSNFNMGIVVTFTLGVFFVVCFKLFEYLGKLKRKKLGIAIKTLILAALAFFIVVLSIIFFSGGHDTAKFDEDALIVLGSGIRGETVSASLKQRLDKALEYWEKNPDAVIIVSGGQGPQEDITEALAMQRYLVDAGVPDSSIVMEDKATSTFENFKYSKEILSELFGDDYTVAFITNSFHIYRTGITAKLAGIDARSFAAKTGKSSTPMVYSREVLAVLKFWVLKY